MAKETPDNLEQHIKELIAGVIGREPEELKPETNFWKDLGVDSIKAIEITVAMERRFKVSVRDEEIPKIATVGDAIRVVTEALAKKG